MEKRTILTIFVMLAFFAGVNVIYTAIYPPKPPTTSSSQTSTQTPATSQSPTDAAAVDSSAEENLLSAPMTGEDAVAPGAQTSAPAKVKDIVVKTPNYRAVFTENGAKLKSLTLTNYYASKTNSDLPDVPQELVPSAVSSSDYPLSLRLIVNDNDYLDLGALAFVADKDSLEATDKNAELTFTGQTVKGLEIKRVFTFDPATFFIGQKVILANNSQGSYTGRLGQAQTSGPVGKKAGRYDTVAGYFDGKLFTEAVNKAPEELAEIEGYTSADWLGYMSQYFLSAQVLGGGPSELQSPSQISIQGYQKQNSLFQAVVSWPLQLRPGATATYDFSLYYGPKDSKALANAGHNLEKSIDFGWFGLLALPLAWLIRMFYDVFGNYGVSILMVTLLIKVALWPLTVKSYKSMKGMQKLQPRVTELREKYKDDRETLNREMLQLYRTYKVSPLGGCLPMLLQIPFFIAFYRVLDYALELRGAPFVLWIKDLSAPDRLFDFGVQIPFL
ncbi:MAG: membrane protein insertase YidC, partial [Deltaproteobacteria bacterium]|nr:membrane protein insertase YidC [Deltaproteobacteria bacterium]